ncbi:MAG: transcription-repair coupling factor [Coriobacteriia bacterium]
MERLRLAPAFARAAAMLAAGDDCSLALPGLVRPVVTAALYASSPRPTLVVVPGEEAAERFVRQVAAYLPRDVVLPLPTRLDMPWSREPADLERAGRRGRALYALDRGRDALVVTSARALLRRLPPPGAQVFDPVLLAPGAPIDLDATIERLARMGYERLPRAESRGEFAVRGGILDVFPSDAAYPVRAELSGDEVESLVRYVSSTQQAVGPSGPVEVFPCREVRLGTRAAQSARRAFGERAREDEGLARDLERIDAGICFDGVEGYLPHLYKETATVIGYVSPATLVVVAEPRAIFDDMVRGHEDLTTRASAAGRRVDEGFVAPGSVDLGGRQRITYLSLLRAGGAVDGEIAARRPEVAGGEEAFVSGVRALLDTDHRVLVAARDRAGRERLAVALTGAGISVEDARAEDGLRAGVAALAVADIPAGYVVPDARLAVVSMEDVFPRARRAAGGAVNAADLTFSFKPGDHVVHAVHGIALLVGIVRQTVAGVDRDYLLLEYAKGDKLYVPVEQIDRVTRYVGPDGGAPKVTRLNTADWSRATRGARAAARKLAFDLVDLYARRATVTGFAFSPDTPWQMEMEAAFPFEETPDQLAAIADVKSDMESEEPMDRLVCGDVGYGKTEVAIRAAFKAAQDGKQVIVLCPTTILAQQHFTTFSERYAPFPVRVEVLSRFRSKAQQADALAGFAAGSVDVLIGTHRLLSQDVGPHDLGLVVIDEEQRFGVGHKEHMKHLREQVDVLTLTATPIPRTLQMSLSGVRDLSVIDTAPPNRFPVAVHVGEWDAEVVGPAIRREIERGGQVYYVSNRVGTIDDAARRVCALAPEARVSVAHGQMSERELERVMESFSAGRTDILVSTTIVESGIDNPHTNTLVIEDSERLGLAQLYQLKGRVGRSHVKAYAYFLFPSAHRLTDPAYERLTAIRDNADLGSGMKVALRDLEIRGAGSLLGAEQHGNLSAVGFDLYAQMLKEAVAEARGEAVSTLPEVRVDIPVPAFLPDDHVPDVDERVAFYRQLAGAPTPEAVERVASRLRERHGPPPPPAAALLAVARIRALAIGLGVANIAYARRRVVVKPVTLDGAQRGALAASRNAVYLERDRSVSFVDDGAEGPVQATLDALNAILSVVESA